MQGIRSPLPVAAATVFLAVVITSGTSAFHDGGVADCEGCHVMHESEDGSLVMADQALLRVENATDLCLTCHATANGAVLAADVLNPRPEKGAGNFIFLYEDNLDDHSQGMMTLIPGNHAGHSIISPAWGLLPDPVYTTSPGGSYLAMNMGCTSCHNPHGSTSYRMLWGAGSRTADGFLYTQPAPQAVGLPLRSAGESPSNHAAYRSGWNNWCGNCHGSDYHKDSGNDWDHDADKILGGSERDSYNTYDGDSNPTSGIPGSAYIPEVPFEDPSMTTSSTAGPSGTSRIMCLTCHRAHATSAPHANRWDPNVIDLNEDGLASGSYPIPNPYPGMSQRALCVKCHEPDTRTHGQGRPCMDCHRQDPGGGP